MENFIVSARKYRPGTFASVVGQESIANTLKNAIKTQHLAHAYLFCGPRGVGKTTCARIFAKTINCMNLTDDTEPCGTCESCVAFAENRSYNIHELDAASNNSVEDIRGLNDQVRIPPQIGTYSVYIIDEVHMLSSAAFNAFLKTLEEPPAHAIFVLATTEKHKILPTILSRCQIFDFNRMKISDIEGHIQYVAEQESITIDDSARNIIAQKADGAMRDALSIFDQIVSFSGKDITYEAVLENLNVLDYTYYFKLIDGFLKTEVHGSLLILNEILENGFDAQHFVTGLCRHFRDLMVCSDSVTVQLLEVSGEIRAKYQEQAQECSQEFLIEGLRMASDTDIQYKTASDKRLLVELMIIRLAQLDARLKKKSDDGEEIDLWSTAIDPIFKVKKSSPKKEEPKEEVQKSAKTLKRSGSISDALAGNIKTSPSSAPEAPNQPQQAAQPSNTITPFNQQQLNVVWKEMARKANDSPLLIATINKRLPLLQEGYVVRYAVENAEQEKVMQAVKPRVIKYLQHRLRNNKIQFDLFFLKEDPSPREQRSASLNTKAKQQEALNKLLEENPDIAELMNKFNLDFD